MTTLTARSALDARILGTYTTSTPADIEQCLLQARLAATAWDAVSVKQRLRIISVLKTLILNDIDALTATLVVVTGKVKTEVLLGEIYPVLDQLRYYEQHAPDMLATRKVATSPFAFPNAEASVARCPFGVVAVMSPWNFPWQLTIIPIITALIAGNAVIFKTAELSLPIGEQILHLFHQIDLPAGLVQQVIGGVAVGEQLIDKRPDLVFVTGGVATGRQVMARAAQHPIPVILELGGKDAMLVFADANLTRACNAALYGAFSNSGQVCVATERLYVQATCYNQIVQQLCAAVATLTVGHGAEGDVGALTTLTQFEVVKAHYDDALAKGAKASGPLQLQGRYLHPVVLWDVTHAMRIMQEETFGALLPVMPFTTETEAIHLANDSDYGLNASVWSLDLAKAQRVARQLKVGNWAVNDVLKNIGHPGLPFGGVKNSGFGRYHGAEGLRSFTYTVAGLSSRSAHNNEPNWFPYSERRYTHLRGYLDCLFGSGTLWQRIARNWLALQAFRGYASLNLRQHWQNLCIFLGKDKE